MYINMIIPHHEGAIEMARMVVNDAPHQAVRTAAAKIIKDQQQEINELTSWLKAWYGQRVRPDQRMMMDASMMQHMQQADAAMREKMFLAVMREHHQSAVDIGQLVLQKATHRQLKGQAQTMVDSQRREQQQFGTWLQQWYGITAPKPTGDMQDGMDAVMGMVMPETGAEEPLWAVLAAGALALFGGGFLLRRKLA
jgi:LPXTG-motif cell wall-anchored protein